MFLPGTSVLSFVSSWPRYVLHIAARQSPIGAVLCSARVLYGRPFSYIERPNSLRGHVTKRSRSFVVVGHYLSSSPRVERPLTFRRLLSQARPLFLSTWLRQPRVLDAVSRPKLLIPIDRLHSCVAGPRYAGSQAMHRITFRCIDS